MGLQIWGILFKQSKIGPEELEKMRHVRHIIYTQFRDVGIYQDVRRVPPSIEIPKKT